MHKAMGLLVPVGVAMFLVAARFDDTCTCTNNGNPGSFTTVNVSCSPDTDPVRAVTDNSVCNNSNPPNDCHITGSLTADLCGGTDSCVYVRTDIPGGTAYNWGSSNSSNFTFTGIPSSPGEPLACNGTVTRFVRFEFTNGSARGAPNNDCGATPSTHAVWIRNYRCDPP